MAHSLVKLARNLFEDMYWIEDTPLSAADALYYDFFHINEGLNSLPSPPPQKKKKKKKNYNI